MLETFIGLAYKFIVYGGALFMIALILMYFFQDRMLYIPNVPTPETKYPENNPPTFRSPSEHMLDFEDVVVETSDGYKLRGWFIKQPDPEQYETIIFFHANAANIGFRLPNLKSIYEKCEVNILIVGYRGFGHSEGIPNEAGLRLDAEAIFDWAIANPQINNSKIFIFGRSLGGAVAVHLCSKRKENIQGLILENTFTSIGQMVDHIFPFISFLKQVILCIDWNSLDAIKDLKLPILFISGRNDNIVPPVHMDRLYEGAKQATYKDMYKIGKYLGYYFTYKI